MRRMGKEALPRKTKWRLRLISASVALLGVGLYLGVALADDSARSRPASTYSGKNRYFRFGNPYPLAFSEIRSETTIDDLLRNPRGGELFEVGCEWQPKSGPFVDVNTEPSETTQGVCTQYQVRPQLLSEFRASLEEAFADQIKEHDAGSVDAETWPNVRGTRLALQGDLYCIYPLGEEEVADLWFITFLKRGGISLLIFMPSYFVISILLRRRLAAF